MICPNDVPIYTVTSSDGCLNGDIPENLEISWYSYGFMLHPSTPAPPFHCGVSASLGGYNYNLYVTVSYNGKHVSASKTGIRVVQELPLFHLTQTGNTISTTIDVTLEEKYGITGYHWEVGNIKSTERTFSLPKLPVGFHTVKCTVKTLCGERSETIPIEVKPDCGQYCPLEVEVSQSTYGGKFTLTASISCDLVIKKVRWSIFNSCTYDYINLEGTTINLSADGIYRINCEAEIEGCFGSNKSAYVSISGTCPRSESAHYSYPNPANDILHVDLGNTDAANVRKSQQNTDTYDIFLYDSFGNKLQTKTTKGSGKVEFNVSNLTVGIYYIHMYNRNTKETNIEKVIIER